MIGCGKLSLIVGWPEACASDRKLKVRLFEKLQKVFLLEWKFEW